MIELLRNGAPLERAEAWRAVRRLGLAAAIEHGAPLERTEAWGNPGLAALGRAPVREALRDPQVAPGGDRSRPTETVFRTGW